MNALIWGAGGIANDFLKQSVFYIDYHLVALTDNDSRKWGKTFEGYRIISPDELCSIKPDTIIICSKYEKQIRLQINEICKTNHIDIAVLSHQELRNILAKKIIDIYSDCNEEEIKEILNYYLEHGFNIYGSYHYNPIRYDVIRDSDEMPYILFEGKRMYFPRTKFFERDSRGEYLKDVLCEQQDGSPHLYIRDNNDIPRGGIIVDAGVCEGNFSLRYIERVSKVYLIESDPEWIEPLERTFQPFRHKVVLCNKFLGDQDSDKEIKLDTLVNEQIDFLKMDIEGSEVNGLRGAAETLRNSNAKCAICSYHKFGDEEKIKNILHSYGYDTDNSSGYMFFTYDPAISKTMDFRRGIVYGSRAG